MEKYLFLRKIKSFYNNFKRRIVPLLLSFLMLFSGVLSYGGQVFADENLTPDYNTNISISMKWLDQEDNDEKYLNPQTNNTIILTQRVYYSSKSVQQDYKPGELKIVTKGLAYLYRDHTLKAKVAADEDNSTVKIRDWSYTYNSAMDEYTFSNNKEIKKDSTLDGYFDLVYSDTPTLSKNDYSNNEINSTIYYGDGTFNQSNNLSISNNTIRSEYNVDIEPGTVNSSSGLNNYVSNPDDYVLVKYDLGYTFREKSRNLESSYFVLAVPSDFVIGYSNVYPTKRGDQGNITEYKISLSNYNKNFVYCAVPKIYLGKTVPAFLGLFGYYYDEGHSSGEEDMITMDQCEIALPNDFSYQNPDGEIYDIEVKNPHKYHKSSSLQSKNGSDNNYTVTTYFNQQSVPCELQTVVDNSFITKADGNYKQLTEDEYSMNSIYVSRIKNEIGDSASLGTYKIYACNSTNYDQNTATLIKSGNIKDTGFSLNFPDGTHSFCIFYENLTESIVSDVNVNANVHNIGDDILFNNGLLANIAFARFFTCSTNAETGEITKEDKTIDSTIVGMPGIDLKANDKVNYGDINLTRDKDNDYLAESNNYIRTYANLGNFNRISNNEVDVNASLNANFDFDSDDSPSQFSLYTILPEGLDLKNVSNINEIFDNVVLSTNSSNISSEYLTQHCKPEIIKNYNGTKRTYLAFHFDVNGLNKQCTVGVNMTLSLDTTYIENSSYSASIQSYLYEDKGVKINKTNLWKDNGTATGGEIYKDVDRNGSTEDLIAVGNSYSSFTSPASAQYGIKKTVKGSSDSKYNTETNTEIGKDYTYLLEIQNGSSILQNISITDDLEALGAIKGEFKSIKFSNGFTGTYDENSHVIKINEPVQAGKILRIFITMSMPNEQSYIGQEAKNNFSITSEFNNGTDVTPVTTESNITTVTIINRLGNIYVTKVDKEDGSTISGATFELYSTNSLGKKDELISTLTTNNAGKANFKKLEYGKDYILVEKTSPVGYEDSSSKEIKVTLDEDIKSVKVENTRLKGSLHIQKSNNLDSSIKIQGAEYSLYKLVTNESGKVTENKIGTYTTDENGEISIKNQLEWGNYRLREMKAPNGYLLDDQNYDFTIDRNNVSQTKEFNLTDKQDEVLIKVFKYAKKVSGDEINDPVQGATFNCYRIVKQDSLNKDGSINLNNQKYIGQYITNENGYFAINEIPYGTYIFTEYLAPRGYEKCENFTVTISPDKPKVYYIAFDQRRPGSIAIQKSDGKNNIVTDAYFTLYDSDMNPVQENVKVNDQGTIAFENLEWGQYYVKETKAPKGYNLDNTTYSCFIKDSSLVHRLKINDSEIPGSIKVVKYDADDETKLLANAEFDVYKNDGTLFTHIVTDINGEASVKNIPWGSYYLLETKAPETYSLDTTKHRFVINSDNCQSEQVIKISNTIKTDNYFTITKKINSDDTWEDHGDVVFNYHVDYVDNAGKTINRTASMKFGQNDSEKSVVIDNIPANVTNVNVYEFDTNRYKLSKVSDNNNNNDYNNSNRVVDVKDSGTISNPYHLDIANDGSTVITFENIKDNWKNYSDAGSVTNNIAKSAKITGIDVKYKIEGQVKAKSIINKDDIEVRLMYDDGTVGDLIPSNNFTIDRDKWPNKAGDYIVNVTYNIFKGSFIGSVDPNSIIEDPVLGNFYNSTLSNNLFSSNGLGISKSAVTSLNFVNSKAPDGVKTVNCEMKNNDKSTYYDGIIAWLDGTDMYISTQDVNKTIRLPENCDSIFSYFTNCKAFNDEIVIDTSYATDMLRMFFKDTNLLSIDLTNWDTRNVTDMSWMFRECTSLKNINFSNIDTTKVTNMSDMFTQCEALTYLDLSDFDFDSSEDVSSIFQSCSSLKNINFSSNINTSKIKNANYMFASTGFDTIDLKNFDFSNTDSMSYMFWNCKSLTSLDLSSFNTSKVTNMLYMFYGCSKLTSLDLSNFDTSKVTNMGEMFYSCSSLTSLDLSNFDTSNVTNMNSMFNSCSSLTSLDLSNFDTSNITDMSYMFGGCSSLTSLDLGNFDTSKVTNMNSMFGGCSSLTSLDINNWDTSNVTSMYYMFANCSSITLLDLSSWKTSNVTRMDGMFNNCSKLKTIYISNLWNIDKVDSSRADTMFHDCNSLVGQSGTIYNSFKIGDEMANYETGYLTLTPNIFLDYQDRTNKVKYSTIDNSSLPIPTKEGYIFDGWYKNVEQQLDPSTKTEIINFINPNNNYSWTKDDKEIWSSGNKGIKSSESKMISEQFTLDKNGVISFDWRSNGESNYDYIGYDIFNVTTRKYLSGETYSSYNYCISNLKGKASNKFTNVTYDLEPGTYQIVFMYGKDSSGDNNEDQGFVKNIYYGTLIDIYSNKVTELSEVQKGTTIYAKWIKN